MGETRVNPRHLLEDIRDGYPYPLEGAILTELVANALDSVNSIKLLLSITSTAPLAAGIGEPNG